MIGSISQYFSIYQFPSGRLLYAMSLVAAQLEAWGAEELLPLVEAATERAREGVRIESSWHRSRATPQGRRLEAVAWDMQVDRTLGGLAHQISGVIHCPSDQEADAQARHALLEPVMAQNRRIKAGYASRRGFARDVDPQTGDELPDAPPVDVEPDGAAEPAPL